MKEIPIRSINPSLERMIEEFKKINSVEDKNVNSFSEILKNLINQVNELQNKADESVQKLVSGETESIHQVMIAIEEADLAFRLMMEVRNKLIEAYQEIMRMQI